MGPYAVFPADVDGAGFEFRLHDPEVFFDFPAPLIDRKRKINQCIEKAPDLCYPFFISLRL